MPMSPDAQRLAGSDMRFLGEDSGNLQLRDATPMPPIQQSMPPPAPSASAADPVLAAAAAAAGGRALVQPLSFAAGPAPMAPGSYSMPQLQPAEPNASNTNSNRVMTSPFRSTASAAHYRSPAAAGASAVASALPASAAASSASMATFTPLQEPSYANLYQGAKSGFA